MRRKKPLQPGAPLKRTAALQRGTPMPRDRLGDKPYRRKAARYTGPSRSVRDKVKLDRARECCENCGVFVGPDGGELHHRHGRQMGGTRRPWINALSNLLYLCKPCHRMVTDTHGNRREYEARGLLVREGINPRGVLVVLWPVGAVYLHDVEELDDGGWWEHPEPDALPEIGIRHDSEEDAA